MDRLNVGRILPNSPRKVLGQIQVIFGPMFSGKSTELIRRVRRFQIAQYNCLVIKYAKDTRYSDIGMATHDKNTMEAVPANCLRDIWSRALQACVIGIDEGQFFPDTVEFCEAMANMGKTIIVAALDGTFQRKPFGNILNLIPLAESVVKLNAVCMQCFKEASYTKRLGAEQEVEVIGGADKYQAVCRVCYGGLMENKENYDPQRDETPPHVLKGKQLFPSGVATANNLPPPSPIPCIPPPTHTHQPHVLINPIPIPPLWPSSLPPACQLHVQHPPTNISTIPSLSKPSQPGLSDFVSETSNMSRPSDVLIPNPVQPRH